MKCGRVDHYHYPLCTLALDDTHIISTGIRFKFNQMMAKIIMAKNVGILAKVNAAEMK